MLAREVSAAPTSDQSPRLPPTALLGWAVERPTVTTTTDDSAHVFDALCEILPAGRVVTGTESLAWARDQSDGTTHGTPAVVVFPLTTDEVAAVVRYAAATGTPVVPQGARTGLAGGANASDGCILLNTSRMNRILGVDAANQTATVQAGVRTIALARAALAEGLFYPPDPGSWRASTIGGNVATNAGGMLSVKYGVTGSFVRQLTVVLADGSVITTGQRTIKGVAGYDFTALLIGSEGTLGIITEITVGLLPAAAAPSGVSASFSSIAAALDAASAIVASPRGPSVLEFLDASCVAAIAAYDPTSTLPAGTAAVLLVQSDAAGHADDDVRLYASLLAEAGATGIEQASGTTELEEMMTARRLLHPAVQALRGASLNEDITVPRSALPELLAGVDAIARELTVPIAIGGHLGDCNLHPIIGFDPASEGETAAAWAAYARVIHLAIDLGGSATGEHGVGLLKREHLDREFAPAVRDLQRRVKTAFDPAGILNPGKKL
jgi:glycolate oxidase